MTPRTWTAEQTDFVKRLERERLLRTLHENTSPLAATEASASPVPHVEVVASNSLKETIA